MTFHRSTVRRVQRYLVAIALAGLLAAVFLGDRGPLRRLKTTSDLNIPEHGLRQFESDILENPTFDHLKRQSDDDDSDDDDDDDPYDSNPPSEQDPEEDPSEDEGGNAVDEQQEWTDCVNRGCKLNELMKTSDSDLDNKYKSEWHNWDDIEKHGWTLSKEEGKTEINDDEKTSAVPALRGLGIPGLNDPSWQKYAWIHDRETKIGGKTYPATQGEFINIYNTAHGIILATDNHSPQMQKHGLSSQDIVALGRWSDMTYLSWLDVCQLHSLNPSKLKYIIRLNVVSEDAKRILAKIALEEDIEDFTKPYPGVTVRGVPDSNEARATIGFSNGRGVVWFLIQHKGTFGDKRFIKDIKFWDSNNGVDPGFPWLRGIPNILYTLS